MLGKDTLFSAVAVKSTRPQTYELRHRVPNEDDEAIMKDFGETGRRGFRPLWDWRYQDQGKNLRTRLWLKEQIPNTLMELSPKGVPGMTEGALREGAIVTSITPCQRGDQQHYIVITDDTRRPCKYSLDAARDQLPEHIKQIEAKGWSLDQLTAYDLDRNERFVVVESKNAGKPARTVEWDIPEKKLTVRITDQKKNGLMPWCLTAYGSVTDLKYAVIWSPFAAEKK